MVKIALGMGILVTAGGRADPVSFPPLRAGPAPLPTSVRQPYLGSQPRLDPILPPVTANEQLKDDFYQMAFAVGPPVGAAVLCIEAVNHMVIPAGKKVVTKFVIPVGTAAVKKSTELAKKGAAALSSTDLVQRGAEKSSELVTQGANKSSEIMKEGAAAFKRVMDSLSKKPR